MYSGMRILPRAPSSLIGTLGKMQLNNLITTEQAKPKTNLQSATFADRNRIISYLAGNKLFVRTPVEKPVDAIQTVATQNLIDETKIRVIRLRGLGLFDWDKATKLEHKIAVQLDNDVKDNFEKSRKLLSKVQEKFLKEDVHKKQLASRDKKLNVKFVRRRVSLGIVTKTITKEFDKENLKVGRYNFVFVGDNPDKILNKVLPISGKAEGKDFVIRSISRAQTETGADAVIVGVDLNENIIPLLLVAGAVGSVLLGGTGFVLHKTEKVLSSPLLLIAVIGAIGIFFVLPLLKGKF